jgi:uncharacterized protein YbaR (Trm112 family)
MYLRKGIPLLLENDVGSILVLLDSPEPEDTERGPLVFVDSLEPAVDDTRLELVERARGDEELVCWRENERRWRRIVRAIPSATERLGDMEGGGWTGRG